MPISYIAKHKGAIMKTVNEIIEYLIKNQDEVADMVMAYQTLDGELVVMANTYDPITAVGIMTCAQQVIFNHARADEYELEDGE